MKVLSFMQKAEIHRAMNSLMGILAGVVLEGQVAEAGRDEMRNWYFLYAKMLDEHMFREIRSIVHSIRSGGALNIEDVENTLWECRQITLAGDELQIK